MTSTGPYFPEERALALRTIVYFLLTSRSIRLTELIGPLSDAQKETKEQAEQWLRQLTRNNTAKKLREADVLPLQDILRNLIGQKSIRFPLEFEPIAEAAGIFRIRHPGIPGFIDQLGLRRAGYREQSINQILEYYGGCWDLYRLATASTRERVRINRAFLNIKPQAVMRLEKKTIAEFSIHQRSEEPEQTARGPRNATKVSGVITHTQRYITLLGEREEFGGELGNVGLLTWPYPDINKPAKDNTRFAGVSLVPNSAGNEIAAYFVASFVDGSHQYTGAQYDEERSKRQANVGTFDWRNLRKDLKSEVRQSVDDLIEASASHLVFVHEA
jgi:hypothetical protein